MKIKINKKFLVFREEAKNLEKLAKETLSKSKIVYFDFSKVEFLTRSFIDELLNLLKNEKRIKILNLKPHLKKFLEKVKKTKTSLKLF